MAQTLKPEIEPPKVTFERFERGSNANRQRRAAGETRGIVYDFNVLIDGEHRATWHRNISSAGYSLFDVDHRPIMVLWNKDRPAGGKRQVEVSSQASFAAAIESCVIDDVIPTVAEMARLREIAEAEKHNAEIDQAETDRVDRIKRAAVPLYEALKRCVWVIEQGEHCKRDEWNASLDAAFAAIALAERGKPYAD